MNPDKENVPSTGASQFPSPDRVRSIGEMMPEFRQKLAEEPKGRKRKTERGELMRFFQRHLNYSRKKDGLPPITMAHLGVVLEKIPTADLYYLKSVCMQAKNFSKKFWWELDPTKHPPH